MTTDLDVHVGVGLKVIYLNDEVFLEDFHDSGGTYLEPEVWMQGFQLPSFNHAVRFQNFLVLQPRTRTLKLSVQYLVAYFQ